MKTARRRADASLGQMTPSPGVEGIGQSIQVLGAGADAQRQQNPVDIPLNPGCFIGILIMAYCNPHLAKNSSELERDDLTS